MVAFYLRRRHAPSELGRLSEGIADLREEVAIGQRTSECGPKVDFPVLEAMICSDLACYLCGNGLRGAGFRFD
jgi:hypothetical protein